MQSNKRARVEEQKHLFKNPNHFVDLNNARLSGHLCDVTIKVNDKEFQAHKIILAMNLKYFKTMFLNAFQESKQDVITMQDVRESDLEALIIYAYTGDILITENNVLNLFEVANYLTEDSIKEACVDFLKTDLKKEDACLAYKLANSTECSALKNIAKQVILSNFEDCSLTADYLNLDYQSLKDILSYNLTEMAQSQEIIFEGMIKWILHDVKKRSLHVNDLLDKIEINKLSKDYLLSYFCEWIEDQSHVVKDIMYFYRTKSQLIQQAKNREQSLMVIGDINKKIHVQFYDFSEKKWTLSRLVTDKSFDRGIIFNNMFYYTTYDNSIDVNFQVFNPMTMQSTMLTSDRRLLRWCGVCADTKKLYFFGGFKGNGSASNQVLSYDPQMNSFEKLPNMKMKRWSPSVILHQDCFFVLGGNNGLIILNSVEKYDPHNMNWTVSASMCEQHCGHAIAVLDGKLYACRSTYKRVQVYDILKNGWKLVASMNKLRSCYPLIAHKGKLLAVGGDSERTVEVYDPTEDQWQTNLEMSSGLQINKNLRGGLIPINCISNGI